jgi:hypothetical protein
VAAPAAISKRPADAQPQASLPKHIRTDQGSGSLFNNWTLRRQRAPGAPIKGDVIVHYLLDSPKLDRHRSASIDSPLFLSNKICVEVGSGVLRLSVYTPGPAKTRNKGVRGGTERL